LYSYSEEKVSSKLYYLEYKGNRDNYIYGSLYRLDVPMYEHTSFCIGLLDLKEIAYRLGVDKKDGFFFYVKHSEGMGEKSERYHKSSEAWRFRDKKAKTYVYFLELK
jgi:hypothetical protein